MSLHLVHLNNETHPMPGPDSGSTMAITTHITNPSRRKHQSHYHPPSSRNNLITIQCSNQLTTDQCKQQHVACNINAQSVRKKSAVIFDYIYDHTLGIVALTEHWLTYLNSLVRAELCKNGYKILDHMRSDCCGGRTGIISHKSLDVKKIDAGESVWYSYEFSEWIVKSGGYSIRVADHPSLSAILSVQMTCIPYWIPRLSWIIAALQGMVINNWWFWYPCGWL